MGDVTFKLVITGAVIGGAFCGLGAMTVGQPLGQKVAKIGVSISIGFTMICGLWSLWS